MSYNYLPLDRKWLSFEQVKNLLDYDQQVSITFDAHERILKCRDYVSGLVGNEVLEADAASHDGPIISRQGGIGEEVPRDIVKLMLMLKIKSLSYGHGGVQIETVKRLMEMYNNGVLPVIFTGGGAGSGVKDPALVQLSQPLSGGGMVCFKGTKSPAAVVLQRLHWEPVELQFAEAAALTSGTHFITAYGLYSLKKAGQLLKMADLVASLSYKTFGCEPGELYKMSAFATNAPERPDTSRVLRSYREILPGMQRKGIQATPQSFVGTALFHDTINVFFETVLNTFLAQANSVTENPVIVPAEDRVLINESTFGPHLTVALDTLAIAMASLASVAQKRMTQLARKVNSVTDKEKRPGYISSISSLQSTAAAIGIEIKRLSLPVSAENMLTVSEIDDVAGTGPVAALKCLTLILHVEKILAIELLLSVDIVKNRQGDEKTALPVDLLTAIHNSGISLDTGLNLDGELEKAVEFIGSYKTT